MTSSHTSNQTASISAPSLSEQEIERIALGARSASRAIGKSTSAQRTAAIFAIATKLRARAKTILEANAQDVARAIENGQSPPLVDRLRLDEKRLEGMALALLEISQMPDPVGAIENTVRRPNNLLIGKQRIPLGVVLMVFEARPNVTTDAAGLCLRSGNAAILRGGSEAFFSNSALAETIAAALAETGFAAETIQLVPTTDRGALLSLLKRNDAIDLVIPRGGKSLIEFVTESSKIPVIQHYQGICHIYVESSADIERTVTLCENAKAQRPSACNAVETILVDRAIAKTFLPLLAKRFATAGVELRGDAEAQFIDESILAATEEDWSTEYLAPICAVRVVSDIDAAIAHIERYGSNHTEAICTSNINLAQRFVDEVHSSTVLVNASTRFADGGELGLGAEIGISTSKLHAFGPMGAKELTTTKFVVHGNYQTRSG